jgi:hypothetical protein
MVFDTVSDPIPICTLGPAPGSDQRPPQGGEPALIPLPVLSDQNAWRMIPLSFFQCLFAEGAFRDADYKGTLEPLERYYTLCALDMIYLFGYDCD